MEIKTNTEILNALNEYQKEKHYGLKSGIENLDHIIRLDRQRFCIITSNENQGKSTFLNYYCYMMAKSHHMKTLFLSFENSEMRFYDALNKVYGNNDFVNFSRYMPHDFTSLDEVFKSLKEYKDKWGYDILVIDPFESFQDLMNGSYRSEDYGRVLEKIRQFTQQENIITILAAHQRKLNDGEEPTINNIFGSVSFGNKADFIFSIKNMGNFITKLFTLKIRHNFEEGIKGQSIYFSFDPRDGRYTPTDYEENTQLFEEVALTPTSFKMETEKAVFKAIGEEKRDAVEQLPTEQKTSQPVQENKPINIVTDNYEVSIIEKGVSRGKTNLMNCLTVGSNNKTVAWTQNSKVQKLREMPYKSESYNIAKGQLLAFTPSCTIEPAKTAQKDNIMAVNNILCVDIDAQDNSLNTEEIKNKVTHLPWAWIAHKSVSGKGIFLLCKIHLYGHTIEQISGEFKAYYNYIGEELKKHDISIDKQCSNINRTRYMSIDENAIINNDAQLLDIDFLKAIETLTPSCATGTNDGKNKDLTERDIKRFLEAMREIENNHLQITKTHEESRSIGRAIANVFGEDGRKYYHIIRAQKPNYDKEKSDNRYTAYMTDGMSENYTIATFFKYYNENKIIY